MRGVVRWEGVSGFGIVRRSNGDDPGTSPQARKASRVSSRRDRKAAGFHRESSRVLRSLFITGNSVDLVAWDG